MQEYELGSIDRWISEFPLEQVPTRYQEGGAITGPGDLALIEQMRARAAFDPRGTMLAAGGTDGLIRLWGAEGDEPIATLAGHEGTAGDVAFRPNGAQLASCGLDKTVRLWDVATRQAGAVLHGHTDTVYRVAYSADGRLLASASEDRTVRLWEAASGEALAVLPHGSIVYGVAFNPRR